MLRYFIDNWENLLDDDIEWKCKRNIYENEKRLLRGLKPIDQWSLLEYKKAAGIPLADAKEKWKEWQRWEEWEERKVQIEMSKAEKEIFDKLDYKIQNFIFI